MRGSNCNLVIRQTAEEKFKPELYVEKVRGSDIDAFSLKLKKVLASLPYDSITVVKVNADVLRIGIPAKYRVSHEDHFAQVTSKFLNYLNEGKIPEWEIQAMITKYYTTTSALKKAIRTDSR